MADRWWGYIEIENVPADWVAVEKRKTDRHEWQEYVVVLDAMPEAIAAPLRELDLETAEHDEDKHTLMLTDDQLAGGSWAILESGLPEALIEAGVPFKGGDDGMYESDGCSWWWRPGMDSVEHRVANRGGIVLGLHDLRALWPTEQDAPLGLNRLREQLAKHFDVPIDQIAPEEVTT